MATAAAATHDETPAAYLRAMLPPGTTVFCILRHVARSGMFRKIDLILFIPNDARYPTRTIGWNAAQVLGMKYDRDAQGVNIGGGGMDMGFELVYRLGRALYPEGFELPAGQAGRNGDTSGYETDGGYAFRHQWL